MTNRVFAAHNNPKGFIKSACEACAKTASAVPTLSLQARPGPVPKAQAGFTLLETVIYIGLFGILITGIFVSIYPFLSGSESLTKRVTAEAEASFVLWKIRATLADSITSDLRSVSAPLSGATATSSITISGANTYVFKESGGRITLSKDGATAVPITGSRVAISNFAVKQVIVDSSATADVPRYIEVSFNANEVPIGPVRYYLHFPH